MSLEEFTKSLFSYVGIEYRQDDCIDCKHKELIGCTLCKDRYGRHDIMMRWFDKLEKGETDPELESVLRFIEENVPEYPALDVLKAMGAINFCTGNSCADCHDNFRTDWCPTSPVNDNQSEIAERLLPIFLQKGFNFAKEFNVTEDEIEALINLDNGE